MPRVHRGGLFIQSKDDALLRLMDHCNLRDLNTIGGKFTWHCHRRGQRPIAKKLDRALAKQLAFPEAIFEVLCRHH